MQSFTPASVLEAGISNSILLDASFLEKVDANLDSTWSSCSDPVAFCMHGLLQVETK